MSLPWRTFTESKTFMDLQIAGKVSDTHLGEFYNMAYQEIVVSHQWTARTGITQLNTVNEYSTGTIQVTQNSTSVVGTDTVWTSAMIGRAIRISDQDVFYIIATVPTATTMTLTTAWPGDNATGESYVIFQHIYPVGAAGEVGSVILPSESWAMREQSVFWVEGADPSRRTTGDQPVAWIPHGLDSSHKFLIEFWPRFSSATTVRVAFYKRVDVLTASQLPIVRADLVEALAMSYALSQLWNKFGDQHYQEERDVWEKRYAARLETALIEDYERHGLPREVQASSGPSLGHRFYISHDV